MNAGQVETTPAAECKRALTAAETTLEFFAHDTCDPRGRRKLNAGPGGSMTCAFLRHIFASGLPSGFGIAEIGVWHGDTSIELAEMLPDDGFLHIFDYDVIVQSVKQRLAAAGHINVSAFGCSARSRDSYNWSLMRQLIGSPLPIYDYIFLDGAHTWDVDGLAFFLLDRLLKPGGYMDFDDYGWTIATSPTLNPITSPQVLEWFTEEQINTSHVMLIVELLVKRDRRYQQVVNNKIFRKISA